MMQFVLSSGDAQRLAALGFDPIWYLNKYPDVQALGMSAEEHFLWIGERLGRLPCAKQDREIVKQSQPQTNILSDFECKKAQLAARRKYKRWNIAREQAFLNCIFRSYARQSKIYDEIKASIILPTYNRAGEIDKAILSVLAQTHQNWELLIVDDGSEDNTEAVVQNYSSDPRIKYVKQNNKGVSAARNNGLLQASGSYIFYLDSDNSWTPMHVQALLVFMKINDLGCAYSGIEMINDSEEVTSYRGEQFIWELCHELNYIDLNSFAHRADIGNGQGFDETLRRLVDWDYILRLTRKNRTAFAPFIGVTYYIGDRGNRITQTVYVGGELSGVMQRIRTRHGADYGELETIRALHSIQTISDDSIGAHGPIHQIASIVICVYSRWDLTEQCLKSLYATDAAGAPFELIIVNNGDDEETRIGLNCWAQLHPNIRVVYDGPNLNFGGGCNLGVKHARGEIVVLLNNDTEVTDRWLARLIEPLKDPSVMGAQAKLLYPDGTIQGVGLVFNDKSCFPYPIYVGQKSDIWPVKRARKYQAVTAACMAVRKRDFLAVGGFDEGFANGQEDVDLCLRLAEGREVFAYVPDSEVIHHEMKSPGRGLHIQKNRIRFHGKWSGKTKADDQYFYRMDGTFADQYTPDHPKWVEAGYAGYKPSVVRLAHSTAGEGNLSRQFAGRTIAIKIGCPRRELKERWGDYHFASSLAEAFSNAGVNARIDFLQDWDANRRSDDINLVLRGLSKFEARDYCDDFIWIISHPEKVTIEELKAYKHVFVASDVWGARNLIGSGIPFSVLHQCTDPARFHTRPRNAAFTSNNLFVANSRKIERRIVKDAMAQQVPLEIYGEMWEGIAPVEWVRGENISNSRLGEYYANATVVLNDHWDLMRDNGFLSNRVYDALACGAPVVTDTSETFPADIIKFCTVFSDEIPLKTAIEDAKLRKIKCPEQFLDASHYVLTRHTFVERAKIILSNIEHYLARSPNLGELAAVS